MEVLEEDGGKGRPGTWAVACAVVVAAMLEQTACRIPGTWGASKALPIPTLP